MDLEHQQSYRDPVPRSSWHLEEIFEDEARRIEDAKGRQKALEQEFRNRRTTTTPNDQDQKPPEQRPDVSPQR